MDGAPEVSDLHLGRHHLLQAFLDGGAFVITGPPVWIPTSPLPVSEGFSEYLIVEVQGPGGMGT